MPAPINPTAKSNFIALVTVAPLPGGPQEASRLVDIMNTYEDVITAVGRQLGLYADNNAYLIECMATLDGTQLQNVHIYNNKVDSPGTGPSDVQLLCNTTFSGTVHITANATRVVLLGNSFISRLQLDPNVNLQYLYIGPGSTIDVLDASASGAFVSNVILPFMHNEPAMLNSVVFGSGVGATNISEGSFYGGQDQNDPQLPCAKAVTDLVASDITNNSVALSWTPAASGYLFLNLFYKKTDSSIWIPAGEAIGGYAITSGAPTGYVISGLDAGTYYNFKVAVRCNNGGLAVTEIIAQTVCCASG